jgi:hypothetical protein
VTIFSSVRSCWDRWSRVGALTNKTGAGAGLPLGGRVPALNETKGSWFQMRSRFMTVVVAIVALLVLGVVASSASAASPEWYVKKSGVFEKVTSDVAVKSELTLEQTDTGYYPRFGEPRTILCKGKSEGKIEAGGAAEIETVSLELGSCESKLCKPVEELTSLNLPWKTELYKEGSEIRNRIVSGTGGAPIVEVVCKIFGQRNTDECEVNTSTHMANSVFGTLEGVEAGFDTKSNKTHCTWGGKESGVWKGSMKMIAQNGSAIKVE